MKLIYEYDINTYTKYRWILFIITIAVFTMLILEPSRVDEVSVIEIIYKFLLIILSAVIMTPIHEWLHYKAIKTIGGKPKYNFDLLGPYVTETTGKYFTTKEYIVSLMLPFVVIFIFMIIPYYILSKNVIGFMLITVCHIVLCFGDIIDTISLLKFKNCKIKMVLDERKDKISSINVYENF